MRRSWPNNSPRSSSPEPLQATTAEGKIPTTVVPAISNGLIFAAPPHRQSLVEIIQKIDLPRQVLLRGLIAEVDSSLTTPGSSTGPRRAGRRDHGPRRPAQHKGSRFRTSIDWWESLGDARRRNTGGMTAPMERGRITRAWGLSTPILTCSRSSTL